MSVKNSCSLTLPKNALFTRGRLDRQGCVPYDHYIALLGKPFFCWLHHFSFQIYLDSPIPTPCADMTGSSWAYEPEVTAMAYLLETTIACFYSNPGIDELSLYDHWAFTLPNEGSKLIPAALPISC